VDPIFSRDHSLSSKPRFYTTRLQLPGERSRTSEEARSKRHYHRKKQAEDQIGIEQARFGERLEPRQTSDARECPRESRCEIARNRESEDKQRIANPASLHPQNGICRRNCRRVALTASKVLFSRAATFLVSYPLRPLPSLLSASNHLFVFCSLTWNGSSQHEREDRRQKIPSLFAGRSFPAEIDQKTCIALHIPLRSLPVTGKNDGGKLTFVLPIVRRCEIIAARCFLMRRILRSGTSGCTRFGPKQSRR